MQHYIQLIFVENVEITSLKDTTYFEWFFVYFNFKTNKMLNLWVCFALYLLNRQGMSKPFLGKNFTINIFFYRTGLQFKTSFIRQNFTRNCLCAFHCLWIFFRLALETMVAVLVKERERSYISSNAKNQQSQSWKTIFKDKFFILMQNEVADKNLNESNFS